MIRAPLAAAVCLLLAACASTPDAGGAGSAGAAPAAANGAAGVATATGGITTGALPADASLSCDQIDSQVRAQNALVTQAGAASAAAHKGTTTSQTTGTSEMSEMDTVRAAAADRKGQAAQARANQLVTLGKQKHCYPS